MRKYNETEEPKPDEGGDEDTTPTPEDDAPQA